MKSMKLLISIFISVGWYDTKKIHQMGGNKNDEYKLDQFPEPFW